MAAATAGPSSSIFFLDRPFESLFSDRDAWYGQNGTLVRCLGSACAVAAPAVFYLGGVLAKSETSKKVGVVGYEALAAEAVVVWSLKESLGRERPYTGFGPADLNLLHGNSGNKASFPSGDTATAFAVATVVSEAYDKTWISVLSYGLAGAVGVGRMVQDQHWFSDVAAGGAIGWACARAAWSLETNHAWLHQLYTDGQGLYFTQRF